MFYIYELHSDLDGALVYETKTFEDVVQKQRELDADDEILWIYRIDNKGNVERLLGGEWYVTKTTKIVGW
jgi:hypothetical protein